MDRSTCLPRLPLSLSITFDRPNYRPSGTLKFNFDGEAVRGLEGETPESVCFAASTSPAADESLVYQLGMNDGDEIDAQVTQACSMFFFHCNQICLYLSLDRWIACSCSRVCRAAELRAPRLNEEVAFLEMCICTYRFNDNDTLSCLFTNETYVQDVRCADALHVSQDPPLEPVDS